MSPPAPIQVLCLINGDPQRTEPLLSYLEETSLVQVTSGHNDRFPATLEDYHVVMLVGPRDLSAADEERLIGFVHRGGGCLAILGPSSDGISPLFGAKAGPPGPYTQLRVSFADPQDPIARRLPAEFFLHDRFQALEPVNEDVRTVLVTTWRDQPVPMALCRREGAGRVCCMTLHAFGELPYQRIVYRLVRDLAGQPERDVMIGAVVGYGPPGSAGYLHSLSLHEVPGLQLQAVCDLNQERLQQAQKAFPGLRTYPKVDELAADPAIELVIVVTPPNNHGRLAIQLLEAGKHVVVEKPMCLTYEEAAAMIQAAEAHDRVLTVFQNRRWDADFLAIKQAVADGLIGQPFYLETFVGDYGHPCHYWHSHRPVSGGTIFDWGAHYVDWILNLFPGPTASIIGTTHKRVWHDVTNADQGRVQIRFVGGQEAEFIHSDVAALRKPKWYLLGTEGAILGEWHQVTIHEPDPVFYFKELQIPITEKAPRLILRRRDAKGRMLTQELPLPARAKYPFYSNLADHLLLGEPLAVTAQSAARVVAVLEAATRSARNGGSPEELCV